ncbi:MAG: winged helix-turn-helix domain-containing protein [Balneolaceae bacterium]
MAKDFYIGKWLIQPSLNRVCLQEEHWKIEPKIMNVLLCLAEHPNEVVTREFIFEAVWGETIVVDMALTRAISELRSIFKDKATSPAVIETIPKRGYRLIATVDREQNTLESSTNVIPPSASQNDRSPVFFYSTAAIVVILVFIFTISILDAPEPVKTYSAKPVTSLKGWEFNPAFSPDGNSIAFVLQQNGIPFSQIYTTSLDGDEEPVQLTSSEGFHFAPAWSPDGNTLAFYFNDSGRVSIKSIPPFGGEENHIINVNALAAGLHWSPDGNSFAYVNADTMTQQHAIYHYFVEDKTSIKLSFPPRTNWGDHYPRYSPNGDQLAFIRSEVEGKQDLFLIDIVSREEKRLTNFSRPILGFDWADNETLFLSSSEQGEVYVYEFDLTTEDTASALKKLPLGKDKHNPTIHNGQLILEDWTKDIDLFSISLANDEINSLQPSPLSSSQWELHPSYSKLHGKLAFSSNRSGSFEIWTSDQDGSNLQKLSDIGSSLTGMPAWSPAGDVIAFDSRINGTSDIFIIDDSGMGTYQLTKGSSNDMSPTWSADGSAIYFASDRSGSWELWKKPINGDNSVRVTTNGGYYGAESVDGQFLFFTKHRVAGLWRLNLNSMEEELIIPELSSLDWGNWVVTENGIYFFQRRQSARVSSVSFYKFSSGEIETVAEIRNSVPVLDPSIAITPDQKKLLIGLITGYQGDLIMIEDF